MLTEASVQLDPRFTDSTTLGLALDAVKPASIAVVIAFSAGVPKAADGLDLTDEESQHGSEESEEKDQLHVD